MDTAQPQQSPIPPLPKGYTIIDEPKTPALPAGFSFADEPQKKKSQVSNGGGKMSLSGGGVFQTPINTKSPSILTPKGKAAYKEQVDAFKPVVQPKEGQPKPAKKVDGGVATAFMKGLSDMNEGIFKIPRYIYDLAAIPQNMAADLLNMPELHADYDGVVQSSGYTSPLSVLDRLGDHYKGTSNQYQSRQEKYNQGILDSFTSGNYSDSGKQVLNNIAQSVPSVILMATTAGAGNASKLGYLSKTLANALPFASQKNAQEADDSSIPQYVKTLNSTLNGLSEVIFDQSFGTQAAIQRVVGLFENEGKEAAVKAAKELTKGYVSAAIKKVQPLTGVAKGSLEEMTTQMSQNLVDKYTVNPDKDLMEGVLDAGVVGGVMTGTVQSVGTSVFNSSQKKKAGDLMKQRSEIVEDLDNDNLPEDVKEWLGNRLNSIDNKLSDLDDKGQETISSLSEEDRASVLESHNKIQWIEKALQDEDITETSKEVLADKLLKEQDALDEILTKPVDVETELSGSGIAPETNQTEVAATGTNLSAVNTPNDPGLNEVEQTVSDQIPESTLAEDATKPTIDPEQENEVSQVSTIPDGEAVLDRAELDLTLLKSVKDKQVKFDASMRRLDEALNAGVISEPEYADFAKRFSDVIAPYKPKKATASVEEQALLANPEMEVGEQFDIEDELVVPEENKSYHEVEKSKAIADIKTQWSKLSVVGISDDPIQRQEDVVKLFEAIKRYAYHGILDGSIKLKGRISDKVDEIVRKLGLTNLTDQQYEQLTDIIKAQAEKAKADVKKMSPTMKVVIKETTEVRSDFKEKDVISRLTQLKRRLSDEMRGFTKGVKDGKSTAKEMQSAKDDIINGLRTEIKLQVRDARDKGLISGKIKPSTFTNTVNRINNAKTPLQLLGAIDYMSRVISSIDYDANLATANRLRVTIKNLAKRKGLPANITEAMRNIARAVPSELDDIKEYTKLLSEVIANINGSSISGINTALLNDVAVYLAQQKQKQVKERYSLLIGEQDGFGYDEKTISEMKAEIDELMAEDYVQKDNRRDADEAISEMLREDLLDADLSGYTHKQEIEAIDALKTVELSGLTDKELRLYSLAANNLIINGKLNGTSVIIAVARKQKYFKNRALIADIKSTTRAVSKWADNIRADWANIPTQIKAFSNSDRGLAKYYVVTGLSDIKNGYTRVSNRLEQVEKGIEAIIKKSKTLRNEPIKQIEIAVYADLNQYPHGSTQEQIQEEFTGRRDAIALTIERLKEKSSTDKNFQKEHANFIKLLERVYDSVKDARSIDDIKLDSEQKALYDYMRNYFDSIQEDTRLNAEIQNNINFAPINNYFPRSYTRIDKYFGSAAKEELKTKIIGSGIYFGNPDIQKELSGTKNERTIKKDMLPKDRVINLDLVPNFLNTTRNILYDIETQQARIYTQELITSKDDMQALTADDSIVQITNRVAKQLVTNHKIGLLPVEAKGVLKAFGEFWRGSANRIALGGISQWAKQSLSALTTTAGVLGTQSGYLAQSIQELIVNNQAANKLMSGYSISRRAANKSALTHTNVKESDVSKLNRSLEKFLVRSFDNWNDIADKVSLDPLVWGDAVSAKASFLAFYKQYLVKEGIIRSIADFDIVKESESPNDEAAEYAEQMVNTTLNINDRTMAPEKKPLWGILPFLSFSINAKLNLFIDLARVSRKDISMNERVRAARMVVGHVAASVVLNAVGWAVRDMMINDTFDIVTALIGNDDDEKKQDELIKYADELEMEMYNRNAANTFGYIFKDVLIGGILAPVTDPLINPVVDKTIAWYKGEEYKEQYVRPADVLTMIGLYGIPAKAIVNLAEKSDNLMLPDDQFVEDRFGITSADGTQVYIPVTDRDEERPEWAKKAIAVSAALSAFQVLTSMSAQEVSAISRRLPALVKKLEDKRFGAKRKFNPEAEEKALAHITREGVTYVLDEKQLEFRKKAKAEFLADWYKTIKDSDLSDKESEQQAREFSNRASADQVIFEYGFEGLKKKE